MKTLAFFLLVLVVVEATIVIQELSDANKDKLTEDWLLQTCGANGGLNHVYLKHQRTKALGSIGKPKPSNGKWRRTWLAIDDTDQSLKGWITYKLTIYDNYQANQNTKNKVVGAWSAAKLVCGKAGAGAGPRLVAKKLDDIEAQLGNGQIGYDVVQAVGDASQGMHRDKMHYELITDEMENTNLPGVKEDVDYFISPIIQKSGTGVVTRTNFASLAFLETEEEMLQDNRVH